VPHDIWWDSAVYVGMGKYIYSFGESGLWEESRPLVWPLILGFIWKIGLNYVLFGKLLMVFFSSGILMLTYLVAHELFNKKIAIIAALFLSLSSTFFLFGNILHSEIPSTFFVLLGFYLFIKKKYNFSGLFLGIAFMTRFFQIFAFIPLVLLLFYLFVKKKESYKVLFYFIMFFLIPIIPYLILNYSLYNNIFYPFLLQSWMSKYTGWVFSQPFDFYFIGLVKENILVLFSVLALIFISKEPSLNKIALVLMFLFVFVPYNFL
jgi:4-amino-4-deoxy-L-arabinose transferase-like glycosyltransferase